MKAALEKKGTTLSAVARRNDLCDSAVRHALRRDYAARVKALIANTLGIAPQEIWPSLFDSDGKPIPLRKNETTRSSTARKVSGRIHREPKVPARRGA